MSMNTRKAVKVLERRRAHIECIIEDAEWYSEEQEHWIRAEAAALKVLIALGREKMAEAAEILKSVSA